MYFRLEHDFNLVTVTSCILWRKSRAPRNCANAASARCCSEGGLRHCGSGYSRQQLIISNQSISFHSI